MKILQLPRRFVKEDWGGTETVILETSKRLLQMGHQTEILCTMATAQINSEHIDGLRVSRYPYFYPYIGLSNEAKRILDKKGGSPFSFQLMRAIHKMPDLDILHLHAGNRIGGIGRHAALKKGIPYVVSLHGGVFDVPEEEAASMAAPTKDALDWGKALGWWVGSRRVLLDANAILCVGYTESCLAQERFPDKKVYYLPNGADTRRFSKGDGAVFRYNHNIPVDAQMLLTVARLDSQKNQLFLLRMLPELLSINSKTHLVLIGNPTNPEYYRTMLALIESQDISEHVTVIPGIPADSQELVNAYHAADTFVLPSIHEPFGIVILEAWAAGLPVIASRVGGIPHFVDEDKDAMLFTSNDKDSFLNAFQAMRAHPHHAQLLAEAGRKKAREQYDWEVITQRLVKIYEELLHENLIRK